MSVPDIPAARQARYRLWLTGRGKAAGSSNGMGIGNDKGNRSGNGGGVGNVLRCRTCSPPV